MQLMPRLVKFLRRIGIDSDKQTTIVATCSGVVFGLDIAAGDESRVTYFNWGTLRIYSRPLRKSVGGYHFNRPFDSFSFVIGAYFRL